MTDYYSMSAFFDLSDGSGFAHGAGLLEFKERLNRPGVITDDETTVWTREAPGPGPDWPASQVRLLSARMAALIRPLTGPDDAVQWLPAVLVSGDGRREDYVIPHFVEQPDVLDASSTTWAPNGEPIRWVLSPDKSRGRRFFPSHRFARNVIIDSTLCARLRDAGLTGIEIERARVAD